MKQLSGNPLIRLARNLDALIEDFKNHCIHFHDVFGYRFCFEESITLDKYIRLLNTMYRREFVPCSSFELSIIERVLDFKPKIYLAKKFSEYDDDCGVLF